MTIARLVITGWSWLFIVSCLALGFVLGMRFERKLARLMDTD